MANINQAYRKPFWKTLLYYVATSCWLAGFILFLIIPLLPNRMYVVFAIMSAAMFTASCCSMWCIPNENLLENRVRIVLADESMKYSRRLLVPFAWRLEIPNIPSAIDVDGDATIKHVSNII